MLQPGQIDSVSSRCQTRARNLNVLHRQRPDRTDVGRTRRPGVREGFAVEGVDVAVVAAGLHGQVRSLGDLLGEPDAARAVNAPVLVLDHVRPDQPPLVPGIGPTVVDHVGGVEAVLHRVVLEKALSGLIADRAVEGVVLEQELHHRLARLPHSLGIGQHHHAVLGDGGTRGDQARHALHLDETDATLTDHAQAGVVAVGGNLDARLGGGIHEVGALGHPNLVAID